MPSRYAQPRQSGFTLLELMVVVLIMGLGLGLISLAMSRGGASVARAEAEQFMLRASFVSEEVVLNNQIIGLFFEPRDLAGSTDREWCYSWQRFRGGNWDELEALSEYCLPVTLQVDILVENEAYQYDPELDTQPPVVVFYPSGESTLFEIAIFESGRGAAVEAEAVQRIQIDMMGRLRWLNREAELAAERAAR